ncbi:hypothetical protein [Bifidobacterium myosotis]|uniref:Uncharacterized protein n=1 Tax=Bifidobacterium myosotis TaxID=1630166 RepID=A0A5M9ZHV1_9BIFI|nr:hypothetical protein [Bifidobacterium myosotis]KAA8827184.1 hypothetical protein EMO91_09025 [Bifidobacterium myosotis]
MVGVMIRYNRANGDRCVRVFDGPDGYRNAIRDPAYLRDMGRPKGDWELVVIGSDSLDTVMHTHSRYFSGRDRTKELMERFV